MTSAARNEGSLRRFVRRGRLLTVAGTKWRWRVGRGGNVIAYSEHGERRCASAWAIRGMDPDTFDRGQWKRTSDGMVRPADIAKWLLAPNAPRQVSTRSGDNLQAEVRQ
jgi:hypothetical protein